MATVEVEQRTCRLNCRCMASPQARASSRTEDECARVKWEFFHLGTGFAGRSIPNQGHVTNGQIKKTWWALFSPVGTCRQRHKESFDKRHQRSMPPTTCNCKMATLQQYL